MRDFKLQRLHPVDMIGVLLECNGKVNKLKSVVLSECVRYRDATSRCHAVAIVFHKSNGRRSAGATSGSPDFGSPGLLTHRPPLRAVSGTVVAGRVSTNVNLVCRPGVCATSRRRRSGASGRRVLWRTRVLGLCRSGRCSRGGIFRRARVFSLRLRLCGGCRRRRVGRRSDAAAADLDLLVRRDKLVSRAVGEYWGREINVNALIK